jgi:hypothetical protein
MQFRKARETDATDTSFPAKVPTTTRPSGDGVHYLHDGLGFGPPAIQVIPYGTGDENDVFEMRIILWVRLKMSQEVWIPFNVAQSAFVCTMSTQALEDGLVVDTITNADAAITSQSLGVGILSGAGNLAAAIYFATYNAEMVEFIFDATTGNPTGMNAIFRTL